jgi:hypothetical protein
MLTPSRPGLHSPRQEQGIWNQLGAGNPGAQLPWLLQRLRRDRGPGEREGGAGPRASALC